MARVLIVDDALFIRRMLTDILTEAGHDVVGEAGNGEEAVEMHREHQPDLVTMDITMPGMDGIAALRQIVSESPGARVVVCSALGQQKERVIEALKAGAKDFVLKPVKADRVLTAVEKALAA